MITGGQDGDARIAFSIGRSKLFDDFFVMVRLVVTNMVGAKVTVLCRSSLLVAESQLRSIVPFAISGIRVIAVTGSIVTLSLLRPNFR